MTDATASPDPAAAVNTGLREAPRPAGPRGTGKTQERLEREAAARRALFAAALAGFVALFGLVAATGKPSPATSADQRVPVSSTSSSSRVIAEVPVTGLNGVNDTRQTIIRIMAPDEGAMVPHLRTRAS